MEKECIIFIIIIILILLLYRWIIQRKEAIDNVLQRTDEEKIKDINDALDIYGFIYDKNNDIICSNMYPWQREVGYCKLYDDTAPFINMIIDSEPIYFEYDNRRWLIEIWKGQYGMTTGGEIGIYVSEMDDIDIPGIFSGTFFKAVSDEELLNMSFNLKMNGEDLFQRHDYHWWLTGFDVGVFSSPNNLSMEVMLSFPNSNMKNAFLNGLKRAGYKEDEIEIINNRIYFNFDKPKSTQSYSRYKLITPFIQFMNKIYCEIYNLITKDFVRTIDKIDFLRLYYPNLFKLIAGKNRMKKLQKYYKSISSYINGDEE
ncbi:MAG: DUF4474 domain-containing protein [Romboutsia timonensis]|uniref:DUF4474 domain-containing protein n=1 Tax=Romboutsia timonensis TaxID=1776391 RepID=UPI002A750DFC|nr:DUF4474 domain-containing protein [Romboutsia timonensis]MDY3000297.1 DUF4474 domain-containing protein [Romboutsia timonensis]